MTIWTEEEIQAASKLWKDGFSAARIGAIVGRPRNSVCSLAFRLRDQFPSKLVAPKKPSVFTAPSRSDAVAKKPVPLRSQAKASDDNGGKCGAMSAPVTGEVSRPVAGRSATATSDDGRDSLERQARNSRKPVTILDLNSTTCRWPLWGMDDNPGADGLYCGEITAEGSSWCPHHRRLSTGAGTESERRAVKVLERSAA